MFTSVCSFSHNRPGPQSRNPGGSSVAAAFHPHSSVYRSWRLLHRSRSEAPLALCGGQCAAGRTFRLRSSCPVPYSYCRMLSTSLRARVLCGLCGGRCMGFLRCWWAVLVVATCRLWRDGLGSDLLTWACVIYRTPGNYWSSPTLGHLHVLR